MSPQVPFLFGVRQFLVLIGFASVSANGRAASAFVMTVEEPNKGDLFVRFCYEEEPRKSAEAEPEMLAELRKRAYEMKDRAVIETILSRFAEASGHRC